jgi:hypothetical protein
MSAKSLSSRRDGSWVGNRVIGPGVPEERLVLNVSDNYIDLNSSLNWEYGIVPGTKVKVRFFRISSAARKKAP